MFDFSVETIDKRMFDMYNKHIKRQNTCSARERYESLSGGNENMRTGRYHSCKRRREVYLKKLAFFVVTAVLVICFSIAAGKRLVDAHDDSQISANDQRYYKSIEIQSGDTLWDIAAEYTSGNPQEISRYVGTLMKINGLATDQIQEGQYLTVVYYRN